MASPGIGFLSLAIAFRKAASYLSGPRRVAPSLAQSTPAIVGSSLSSLSLSLDWSLAQLVVLAQPGLGFVRIDGLLLVVAVRCLLRCC